MQQQEKQMGRVCKKVSFVDDIQCKDKCKWQMQNKQRHTQEPIVSDEYDCPHTKPIALARA